MQAARASPKAPTGLEDRHLRVVGELTGCPAQTTADLLADPADDRFRESAPVLTRRAELERRAKRVARGGSENRTERTLTRLSINRHSADRTPDGLASARLEVTAKRVADEIRVRPPFPVGPFA